MQHPRLIGLAVVLLGINLFAGTFASVIPTGHVWLGLVTCLAGLVIYFAGVEQLQRERALEQIEQRRTNLSMSRRLAGTMAQPSLAWEDELPRRARRASGESKSATQPRTEPEPTAAAVASRGKSASGRQLLGLEPLHDGDEKSRYFDLSSARPLDGELEKEQRPPPPPAKPGSPEDQLARLQRLRDEGILTESEFQSARSKLGGAERKTSQKRAKSTPG